MQLHPYQGHPGRGDLKNVTILVPGPYLGVTEMNREAKGLWVAALRSNLYPQTFHALRVSNSFCALGVLCDVFRHATGRGEWVEYPDDDGAWAFFVNGEVECGEPPRTVAKWAGLIDPDHADWVDSNPVVDDKAISTWNDKHRLPFPALADKIEAHL